MQQTSFFLIFLAATADPAQVPQLVGHWQNQNSQNEIEALEISLQGSHVRVHAWARRQGSISDWGSADATASTPIGKLTAQSLTATYQLPDRRVILILEFESSEAQRMRVTAKTHFTDNSRRPDVTELDALQKSGAPRPENPARGGREPRPPMAPQPPAGPSDGYRESGRDFLIGNDTEQQGFGLYSYLLIGAPPATDAMKSQYLAIISEYLKLINDIGSLEKAKFAKNQLNVTYLLLTERPKVTALSADWMLDHYNFARAKAILNISGHDDLLSGPYLISVLGPASSLTQRPSHMLLQDMSHCQSDVAASWIEEFERRAGRAEFWKDDTRNQAILALRTFVSNAAAGFTTVGQGATDFKKVVADWITWK